MITSEYAEINACHFHTCSP